MNKIRLNVLGLSSSSSSSNSYALVLGETEGSRRLPIIIGVYEAQAIAMELEQIATNRPMTHDLFKNFANKFDIELLEVVITSLKEGVFFASMVWRSNETSSVIELDARPSDAVAVAIRLRAPIFINSDVMEEAGIELQETEGKEKKAETATPSKPKKQASPVPANSFADISNDRLNDMLQEAIDKEDYEKAARIRDELKRRGL